MKRITAFFIGLVLAGTCTVSQADVKKGEQEGKNVGWGAVNSGDIVSENTASQVVGIYSSNADEEKYYQDGMGDINAEGYNKYQRCLNASGTLTQSQKLECEAIEFVNKNPNQRKLYAIDPKTDPVITNRKKVKDDAFTALANNQKCYQKVSKTNPVYEEESCTQGEAFSQTQCLESVVNDVCPASFEGNTCNGNTGIDRGAMTTNGQHNSYIRYEGNRLKFGAGYRNDRPIGSSTASFKITIRNRDQLSNIKLVSSVYDDAYQLKINGQIAMSVNLGGSADGATYSSNVELGQYFYEGENTIELTVYNTVKNSPYYADLVISIPLYCECTKKKVNTGSNDMLKNSSCAAATKECLKRDWTGTCTQEQQNYVCKNSLYKQVEKQCQVQRTTTCINPSGQLRSESQCREGVDYNSVKMAVNQGGGKLTLLGDKITLQGSWEGAATRNFELHFSVQDKNTVNMLLTRMYYDNRVYIYVNGTLILDRQTSSNGTIYPNLDLKPYLKNGNNVILMRVENWHGPAKGIIDLTTNYQCSCTTTVKDTCTLGSECKFVSEQCTDKSTKVINNVIVEGCWANTKKYDCTANGTIVTDCRPLLDRGCEQIGSDCISKDKNGKCLTYNQKYRCEKVPAGEEVKQICVEGHCLDGTCLAEAERVADADFAEAVTMMEVAREAGVYGELNTNSLTLFKGESNECTIKTLAGHSIMSCCRSQPIPQGTKVTNNQTGNTMTDAYGENPYITQQPTQGSTYQYDDLYNDDKYIKQLAATLTFGWLECNQKERELGIKRGASLCEQVDEWCSDDTIFGCIEKTRSYCCFKSVLAKSINRQGRKQLGLSLNTCAGITVEQLQRIDFAKVDLTEFKNSIKPTNLNLTRKISETEQQLQNREIGGYYND